MKIYLAGCYPRQYVFHEYVSYWLKENREPLKIYLAGTASAGNCGYIWRDSSENPHQAMMKFFGEEKSDLIKPSDRIEVLESFYYVKNWMKPHIKHSWNFLLDSGAFTFMNDKKQSDGVVWDEYLEKYAQFIIENEVDQFFELDIDEVIGIKEVERLRKKLTDLTGKKPIPVWHKSRGKNYWFKMLEEFDYVALGGMASNVSYKDKVERMFPFFIDSAKKAGVKLHALGYTSLKNLHKYPFDSVDSTAWVYGNMGGYLYYFNGSNLDRVDVPDGKKLKSKDAAIHNFREWVKFQKYAIKKL